MVRTRQKPPKTSGRVSASIFYDAHEIIFVSYPEKGKTILLLQSLSRSKAGSARVELFCLFKSLMWMESRGFQINA